MTDAVQATTPPTVEEPAARTVFGFGFEAFRVSRQADALAPALDTLRREIALAFGFKSYEDHRIPADVLAVLDDIDDLASVVCESADDLWKALARLEEAES